MPIATITSVNLPTHQYPHVEVNINDNTLRRYANTAAEYGKTLCVFRSPKGPDGVRKITGLDQFIDTYGEGSVDEYGQPLLNARTLAATNAITQYCLRVTAPDATVANLHIYARYRVKAADTITDTSAPDTTVYPAPSGSTTQYAGLYSIEYNSVVKERAVAFANGITIYTHDDTQYINLKDAGFGDTDDYRAITTRTETITVDETEVSVTTAIANAAVTPDFDTSSEKNMEVYFVAKTTTTLGKEIDGTVYKLSDDIEHYYDGIKAVHGDSIVDYDAETDDNNEPNGEYDPYWKEVRLMTITSLGRGKSGNAIGVSIFSDSNRDKSNDYKNYWFQIYEGSELIEKFAVTLTPNGNVRGESKYLPNVVNEDDNTGEGSSVLRVDFNDAGFYAIFDTYNTRVSASTITYDIFDPFFGQDKRLVANRTVPENMRGISGYTIVAAPGGSIYNNDEEFLPYAVGGTSLKSGDDGAFAPGASDREAAINKAYKDVFAGKSITKKVKYNTINTVVLQGGEKDKKGNWHFWDETEKTLPEGGIDLYFDAENNYLFQLVVNGAVATDINGDPIMTLTEDQIAHNQYVLVTKIGNKIYIPPIESWIPDRSPASAVKEYPYPDILSKNKTEIDFFLDANYDYDTKIAICDWASRFRHEEFVVYLDAGVSDTLVSKVDGYTWVQAFDEATNGTEYGRYWYFSIDAYYGRIKDPYNYKIVEVTSTYNLARHLVPHWAANGGKHIPYAGSLYAVIDSYLPRSIFPLMDEGIDSEHMDRFIEEHVNYAQVNSRGDVIRATQSTRYPILGDAFTLSNLTELNNVHIVLDIKKDVEHVLELFSYQFNETSDLKRFNTIVSSSILPKYSAAQVKSISATFNRTSEEAEYGILHLYIEVVHKNLVKIIMVDIDVNRNTD